MKSYDHAYAEVYAALWAYGADTLGLDGTELVYQTVASLASMAAPQRVRNRLLTFADLGCGVGRTVRDLAVAFPSAQVHGLDTSVAMVETARLVLKGQGTLFVDLDARGLPQARVCAVDLPNAVFHVIKDVGCDQIGRLRGACDVVVSLNTIERASDVQRYITTAISLLTNGGALVLASSLNWQTAADWHQFPTFTQLRDYVASMGRLRVEQTIADLPYFEVTDRQGSGEYYEVSVAVFRKGVSA